MHKTGNMCSSTHEQIFSHASFYFGFDLEFMDSYYLLDIIKDFFGGEHAICWWIHTVWIEKNLDACEI